MSCCGSPRPPQAIVKSGSAGGALQQQQHFLVSQQPTTHPGIINPFPQPADVSSYRPPEITPPSAVYPMVHLNGTTAHSPPTTASTMYGSVPPSPPSTLPRPQTVMYTSASPPPVDPNGPLSPLRRPSPTYPAPGSPKLPNLMSTYPLSGTMSPPLPSIDEGKVSVSIDFGERRSSEPNPTPRSKLTVTVQELPSLAW